jgi:hypothetical protein
MTPTSANGPERNAGGPKRAGSPALPLRLTAVVNGMPADVRPLPDTPLIDVVQDALDQTQNHGRPLPEWTVTNGIGRLLDTSRMVREYGFEEGDTLFIQVSIGAGGSR